MTRSNASRSHLGRHLPSKQVRRFDSDGRLSFLRSSTAERPVVNGSGAGSSPAGGARSPSSSRLKTPVSHVGNGGFESPWRHHPIDASTRGRDAALRTLSMKVRVLLEVPAPPRVDRGSGLRTPVKQFESARWYREGDDPAISTVSKAEQRGSTPRLPAHTLGRVAQPGRGSRSRTCALRVRIPPRPPLRINQRLAPMRCRAPRPASGPRVRVRPSTHRRCGRVG